MVTIRTLRRMNVNGIQNKLHTTGQATFMNDRKTKSYRRWCRREEKIKSPKVWVRIYICVGMISSIFWFILELNINWRVRNLNIFSTLQAFLRSVEAANIPIPTHTHIHPSPQIHSHLQFEFSFQSRIPMFVSVHIRISSKRITI